VGLKRKNRDHGVASEPPSRAPERGSTSVAVVDRENGDWMSDPEETSQPVSSESAEAESGQRPEAGQNRLGEQLIASNLINNAQLQQALDYQRESGGRLGEVLVTLGAVSEQVMAQALGRFFGFEMADLRRDVVDPATLALIPEDIARQHMVFPVRHTDDGLYIAVAEPSLDLRAILSSASGQPVRLLIAPLSQGF
jgi:hypothetical protein